MTLNVLLGDLSINTHCWVHQSKIDCLCNTLLSCLTPLRPLILLTSLSTLKFKDTGSNQILVKYTTVSKVYIDKLEIFKIFLPVKNSRPSFAAATAGATLLPCLPALPKIAPVCQFKLLLNKTLNRRVNFEHKLCVKLTNK